MRFLPNIFARRSRPKPQEQPRRGLTMEPLEARVLLSGENYGSYLNLNSTGGATNTQIQNLLNGTGTSVQFNGSASNQKNASESISGSFTLTASGSDFDLTASSATLEFSASGTNLAEASGDPGGELVLSSNNVSGSFTGLTFSSAVQNPITDATDAAPTTSIDWNTNATDTNMQIQLVGATLPEQTGGVFKGDFEYEIGGSSDAIVTALSSQSGTNGVTIELGRGDPSDTTPATPSGSFTPSAQVILDDVNDLTWDITSTGLTNGTGTAQSITAPNAGIALSGSTYNVQFQTANTNNDVRIQVTNNSTVTATVNSQSFTAGTFDLEQPSGSDTTVGAVVEGITLFNTTNDLLETTTAGNVPGSFIFQVHSFEGAAAANVTPNITGLSSLVTFPSSATFIVTVNTASQTWVFSDPTDSSATINLPQGPFIGDIIKGGTLGLPGGTSLSGGVAIDVTQDQTNNDIFKIALLDASLSLAGGALSVSGSSAEFTLTTGNNTVDFSGTGLSFSILGQQFNLTNSDSSFSYTANNSTTSFSVTDADLILGNGLVSVNGLTGALTLSSDGVTSGSLSANLAISSGSFNFTGTASVTFGDSAITVTASDATLTFGNQTLMGTITFTASTAGNVSLTISGATASFDSGLVSLAGGSGTIGYSSGGFTGTIGGTLSLGTASSSGVSFTGTVSMSIGTDGLSISGMGDTLTVAAQTFTGNFTFTSSSAGVNIQISGVSGALPGNYASVANASGNLTLTSSGVSGSLSGTPTVNLSGFTFSGLLALTFAVVSGQADVFSITGTGDALDLDGVSGATVGGDFAFSIDGSNLNLAITDASAELDNGLVSVTGASASLSVIAGVVSGSFAGTVSAGSSTIGITFSGGISVSFGDGGFDIATPQTGPPDSLTVGGQTVSGSFSFTQDSGGVELSITGVDINIGGGALTVDGAAGSLTINTGSVSGTITGDLAGSFGIFAFNGSLSLSFSTSAGSVSAAISGTNDTLSLGGATFTGNFAIVSGSGSLSVTVTDATASLGSDLVSFTQTPSTSATLTYSNSVFSGSVSGSIILNAGGAGFSGPISITFGSSGFSITGTSDTLTIGTQSFTGSFGFSESSGVTTVSVSGLSLGMSGGAISVSNATGMLTVSSSGISGFINATPTVNLSGFSFTGGLGLTFSPGNVQISGNNATLVFGNSTLTGNFMFASSAGNLNLSLTDAVLSLANGLVSVTASTASLTISGGAITDADFVGTISAGSAAGGVQFSGSVSVAFGSGSVTVSTPNGDTDTFTVGGQSFSAALTVTVSGSNVSIVVSNGSASFAGGVVTINAIGGTLMLSSSGISGSVTAMPSIQFSGFSLVGTLSLSFGSGTFTISGQDDQLTLGDQSLSGNFTLTVNTTSNQLTLQISNVSASLGGGIVTVAGGMANFTIANGAVSGSFTGSVALNNVSGVTFSGGVMVSFGNGSIMIATPSGVTDLLSVAGQTISGSFSFSEMSGTVMLAFSGVSISLGNGVVTASNVNGSVAVSSSGFSGSLAGTISTSVPNASFIGSLALSFSPGNLEVSGTNDQLMILGQTLSGSFTFTQTSSGLTLSITNLTLSLGGFVSVTNGTGTFNLTSSGITGSASGTVALTGISGFAFGGTFAVTIDSNGIHVSGTDDTLTISSLGESLSGNFSFTENSGTLSLAISDLTLTLGVLSLTNGAAMLTVANGNISGSGSGTASISTSGFSAGGTFAFSFGSSGITVTGTGVTVTIVGQTVTGNFSFTEASGITNLSISDLAFSIDNVVTLTNGNASIQFGGGSSVTGSGSATVSISSIGGVSFGPATTVSISVDSNGIHASIQNATLMAYGQTISGNLAFTKSSSGVEISITDLSLMFGGVVSLTNGTADFTLAGSGLTGSASGTISISGGSGVTFGGTFSLVASGNSFQISGTNDTVTIAGQMISGNFSFASSGGTTTLSITDLTLSFGSVLSVINGSGTFTVSSSGLSGTASGQVMVNGGTNYQFSGSFSVSIAPGSVAVSGTNDVLTLFGQTIAGNFSFSDSGGTVMVSVSSLNLSLGGGVVEVTGGAASFTISNGSIAGTAMGTLSVGNPQSGVVFTGNVMLTLASGGFTVTGTDIQVTFAGQTFTAQSVSFSRDSSGMLDVTVTDLSIGGATASGMLEISNTGLSGSITGMGMVGGVSAAVTVTFGNGTYTIGASASINNLTFGGVTVSGTISTNGSSVSITGLDVSFENGLIQITGGTANLTKGQNGLADGTASGILSTSNLPGFALSGMVSIAFDSATQTVTVTGTDDTIMVLGQSLGGDFTITDNSAQHTVSIAVTNLSVQLSSAVSITDGSLMFTLSNGSYSATGTATVGVSFPGVSFNGTLSVTVDSTNGLQVSGTNVSLDVEGQTLSGNFIFEKTTTSAGVSTVALAFEGVNIYFGSPTTGVQISNAYGALLFLPGGVAMEVGGSAAIVGVGGLTLSGTLEAMANDTGAAVNETVSAPQDNNGTVTFAPMQVTFAGNEDEFSGTATLAATDPNTGENFVSFTAGFTVDDTQATSNGTTTTTIEIGAAGITAFVGAGGNNPVGVQITGATLGVVMMSTTTGGTTTSGGFALTATGAGAILGVPDLTLSGTLNIQVNTTGGMVSDTVNVPDPNNPGSTIPVNVDFTSQQGMLAQVSGSINLAVSTFATLTGSFAFSRAQSVSSGVTTTTITASVTNATAFVGSSGGIGVQVTINSLTLTLTSATDGTSSYSLDASGGVALVGIPGLNLSGTATVMASGGSGMTSSFMAMGTLDFSIDDSQGRPVVDISGTVTITQSSGNLDIDFNPVSFSLQVNGTQLVTVTGEVDFSLGSGGFQAMSSPAFTITSFSFLGGPTYDTDPNVTIGPLSVVGLSPIFKDFSFSGGTLSADVGFSATSATLNFGGSSGGNPGGTVVTVTGLSADINLAAGIDLSSFRITSFTSSGAFMIHANSFSLVIPRGSGGDLLMASATGVTIQYDPDGGPSQELIVINSATVTIPLGGDTNSLTATISPYTDSSGNTIPGLAVYMDHFQLGQLTVTLGATLQISSALTLVDPSLSISDFSVSFTGGGASFGGSISIGAASLTLGTGSFAFTGTGISVSFSPTTGFMFNAATLGLMLGGVVSLSATNVSIDPNAIGSSAVVASFSSVSVSLKVGSFGFSGTAGSDSGDFTIMGDGSVQVPQDFTIALSFGAGAAGSLGLPSFIPIQISTLDLTWPNLEADPSDFLIDLSASVSGTIGPISVNGSVQNVVIDVGKLLAGQFPIISIGSVLVTASGNVFGGQLSGTLIIGLVGLDNGVRLPPGSTVTPTQNILYVGIEGSFEFANMDGFQIRFGISSLGPLDIYVEADVPILIFPPAGLALDNFAGDVTFNATPFPTITNASQLNSAAFTPATMQTPQQWLTSLQQDVVNQAGVSGGFVFAVPSLGTSAQEFTDLAQPTVTANSTLQNDFLAQSLSMPAGSTITAEPGGTEWIINLGQIQYLLVYQNGSLNVYQQNFSLDPSLSADLNSGVVTQNLISAFQAAGSNLDSTATIASSGSGATESWTITDGSTKYFIQTMGSVLSVIVTGGSMSEMNGVIKIEASASLIDVATPGFFNATVDLIIETDGKLLLTADAFIGNTNANSDDGFQIQFKLYADLSQVDQGTASILFYFEQDVTLANPLDSTQKLVIPELIIEGGITFSQTSGGFDISIDGEIQYSPPQALGLLTITLTGQAMMDFSSTGFSISFNAQLSASLSTFLSVNNFVEAAGDLVFFSSGGTTYLYGAAELTFQSGSFPFLSQVGITANATFFIEFNSDTSSDHTAVLYLSGTSGPATDIDIQPGSFGFYAVGALTFAKGPISFVLDGVFAISVQFGGSVTFDMFADANLDLDIAGTPILTARALGLMIINSQGFAAALQLSIDTDIPDVTFDFDYELAVNTTGANQSFTLPPNLQAIIAQIEALAGIGSITLNAEGSSEMSGVMSPPSDSVIEVSNNGDTFTIPGGIPTFGVNGSVVITSPGPYFAIHAAGDIGIGPAGAQISLTGSYTIQITTSAAVFQINAMADLGPFGNIEAAGYLQINSSGVFGNLQLGADLSLGPVDITGAISIQLNTTGQTQYVPGFAFDAATGTLSQTLGTITIPGNEILAIVVTGQMELLDSFTLQGSFMLTVLNSGFMVSVNATIGGFFGNLLSVSGNMTVTSQGFSGDLLATFGGSNGIDLAVGGFTIFSLQASFYFEIDTIGQTTFEVAVLGGLDIFNGVLSLTGSGTTTINGTQYTDLIGAITYSAGVLTLEGSLSGSINLGIASATVTASGFINSRGEFNFNLTASLSFGIPNFFSISGSMSMDIGYTQATGLTISASISATLDIFGVSLGVSGSVNYNSDTGDLTIHAEVSIDLLLFTIHIGVTITIGDTFQQPSGEVYLGQTSGGAPIDPTSFPGGELPVNISDSNDNSGGAINTVKLIGGTYSASNGQTITIDYNNYSQTFNDVTELVLNASSDTNPFDYTVDPSVMIPVDITGGDNTNTIVDDGAGGGTITGGDGTNFITGGSGPTTINAGNGTSTIFVGTGPTTVNTGSSGTDTISWNSDTGSTLAVDNGGNGSGDTLTIDAGLEGDNLNLTQDGGEITLTDTLADPTISVATFEGIANVVIDATGGGDEVIVPDLAGTGTTNVTIDLGDAHATPSSVSIFGGSTADQFTVSSGTTTEVVNGVNTTVPDTTVADANVSTIQINNSLGSVGDTLTINGEGGGDTFNLVSSVIPVTLISNTPTVPSDNSVSSFYIGSATAGAPGMLGDISAPITIEGGAATDDLFIDDTQDMTDQSATLSGTSLISSAFANNASLTYSGIESLVFNAGGGVNSITITGDAATTQTIVNAGANDDNVLVDAPLAAPLVINGQSHVFGDVLTVNAGTVGGMFVVTPNTISGLSSTFDYTHFQSLSLNANGGTNQFTINGTPGTTFIGTGTGNDSFTVNASDFPLVLNSGAGDDTFIINGNSAPLTAVGLGSDVFTVNGNGANLTLDGGSDLDTFDIDGNSGPLTINGGARGNSVVVSVNKGTMTINGGGQTNVSIASSTKPITFVGGSGISNVTATAALSGPLTVDGSGAPTTLTLDGAGGDAISINSTSISGDGGLVSYALLSSLTMSGIGSDKFTVNSDSMPTTLNGGGADVFDVNAITSPLTINAAGAASTVNVASPASEIGAPLTVSGDGMDSLNVSDSTDNSAQPLAVTPNSLSGLAMAGINYSGLSDLEITLGTANDNVTIAGTSNAATTLNTGGGNDNVSIESTTGALNVEHGSGTDNITVTSAATVAPPAAPAVPVANSVAAAGGTFYVEITYVGATGESLPSAEVGPVSVSAGSLLEVNSPQFADGATGYNVYVGTSSGGETLQNASPIAIGTSWTEPGTGLVSGIAPPSVSSLAIAPALPIAIATASTSTLTEGALPSQSLYVRVSYVGASGESLPSAESAAISVLAGQVLVVDSPSAASGATSYNVYVGEAPGQETLQNSSPISIGTNWTESITGLVTGAVPPPLVPQATTSTTTPSGGTFYIVTTYTSAAGESAASDETSPVMVPSGSVLEVDSPASASGATGYNVYIGTFSGQETLQNSSPISLGSNFVEPASGLVNGNAITAPAIVTPSNGHTLATMAGPIGISGAGSDVVTVDDTGDSASQSGSLTDTLLSGLGTGGITYSGLATLTISLDAAGNTFTINNTSSTTDTTVNTGAGNDTVNLLGDSGQTTVNTQGGDDTINVSGAGAATTVETGTGTSTFNVGPVLGDISGVLTLDGSDNDSLNFSDTGTSQADSGTLTSNELTGFGSAGIDYSGMALLNISLGSGSDSLTIDSTDSDTPVTVKGGSGNDTFNVNGNSSATSIQTGQGTDFVNVGNGLVAGILGAVIVTGGGAATMNVNDSSDVTGQTAALTGTTFSGLDFAGVTYSGLSALNISLGSGGNTVIIAGTSGAPTTLNSGLGSDSVFVQATTGTLTINGHAGPDNFTISGADNTLNGIQGAVSVVGSGMDVLTIGDIGSTLPGVATLSSTSLTGLDMAGITYNGLAGLNVNLGSGGNTITITSSSAATTTLNAGNGSDTINVQSIGGPVNLNTQGGVNVVNVSDANNDLTGIQSLLSVNGTGGDTLNLNDQGDASGSTDTLSSNTIKGFGMATAGINYSGIQTLNLSLGSGDDFLTILSKNPITSTTLNTGAGSDAIDLLTTSSPVVVNDGTGTDTVNASNDGNVDGLQGALTVSGAGLATVNVDDRSNGLAKSMNLTATALSGLDMAGIAYSGLADLNVNLGPGGNAVTVTDTAKNTITNIITGRGADTVNVLNDHGTLMIKTRAGNDQITVDATNAPTTVNAGQGTDATSVGGGSLNGIQGALTVGRGSVTANDSSDSNGGTGTLTATNLSGLGMGSSGITYDGPLSVELGSGSDTFNVSSTSSLPVTLSTGSGSDQVNFQSTSAPVAVDLGSGSDTVNVGSLAPIGGGTLANIQGAILVSGGGNDALNVYDQGDSSATTAILGANTLSGLGMAGISYSGLSAFSLLLGSGGSTLNVTGDDAATSVAISAGGNAANSANVNLDDGFAGRLTLLGYSTGDLLVGGDFSGTFNDSGSLTLAAVEGSVTSTGILNTASISEMEVMNDVAGDVNVAGDIGVLTIFGSFDSTGEITAAAIDRMSIGGNDDGMLNVSDQ